MKYIPQTIITIPSREAIYTPYLGTLDPWGRCTYKSSWSSAGTPGAFQGLQGPTDPIWVLTWILGYNFQVLKGLFNDSYLSPNMDSELQ